MEHDAFVTGIAAVLWAHAWADHAEGHGCHNLSGCRVEDHMPEIPELAWSLAERAAGHFEGETGHAWPVTFAAAMRAEGETEPDYHGELAQRFGECAAYKMGGHGVGWLDDHVDFAMPDGAMFGALRLSDWLDSAELDLADYAAESCEHEDGNPRCKSCGAYNDMYQHGKGECAGCGAHIEMPEANDD